MVIKNGWDNLSGIPHDEAQIDTWVLSLNKGTTETDSYRETLNHHEDTATRTFHVPWSERRRFYELVLGATNNVEGNLTRRIPQQHPEKPWLYATAAEMVEAHGAWDDDEIVGSNGTLAGQLLDGKDLVKQPFIRYFQNDNAALDGYCTIKVTYTSPPYTIRTDESANAVGFAKNCHRELTRYVERDISFSIQALPLVKLAGTIKFAEGPRLGVVIPEPGVILLPRMQLLYRWYKVPDVNWTVISGMIGKVNDAPFDGAPGYPKRAAQTLLCQAPKAVEGRCPVTGRKLHTITFIFDHNPNGWNKFPDIDGDFYAAGYLGDIDDGVYKTGDFNTLFDQPNPPETYY